MRPGGLRGWSRFELRVTEFDLLFKMRDGVTDTVFLSRKTSPESNSHAIVVTDEIYC